MIIKKGKIKWINLTNPRTEELVSLEKEFGFHPVIIEELKETSARSKVEVYKDYLFVVLQFPIYDPEERVSRKGEIDFLVTKNTVISVHYQPIEPLELIMDKLERDESYKERLLEGSTSQLFYYIIQACLLFVMRQLHHIDEKIEDIRNTLFRDQERTLLEKISYVKRDLLSYHLITQSQIGIFKSLQIIGPEFFGEKTAIYFSDLEGDFLKITQQCENFKQTIEAFENTNTQLLSIQMNKVMQRFSVLAFLTFPIMVILALFTIETQGRPLIGHTPYDFWILVGAVIIVVGIMVRIFKKKGWL
ncbi:MAG: magnesium transporter CorA family protein [Candidatus Paceibacterota bacterium]